jgi:hypothetical protein
MRGEDVRRVLAAVDAEQAAQDRIRAAHAGVTRATEAIEWNDGKQYTMFHRDPARLEHERQAAIRELAEARAACPAARDALTDLLYALPGTDEQEVDRG